MSLRPYLDDGDVQLYHGAALDVLRQLPAGVAQTCVTSPPYWQLRDYGTGTWTGGDATCDHRAPPAGGTRTWSATFRATESDERDRSGYRDVCGKCGAQRVDDQLGLEPTPELYVDALVRVFREVRRTLRDDGTLWLVIGDSYAGSWTGNSMRPSGGTQRAGAPGFQPLDDRVPARGGNVPAGLKPKDLVGIPWRLAFALQADGWYLRSDIVWDKPNPMPESIRDRPTKSHEYVFLFAKSARYYYDAHAIREPAAQNRWGGQHSGQTNGYKGGSRIRERDDRQLWADDAARNARSVWRIPTESYADAHFAVYPSALVARCVNAATSEHGACSECGAPWRRIVELVGGQTTGRTSAQADAARDAGILHPRYPVAGSVDTVRAEHVTRGWEPSCSCERNPFHPDYAGAGDPRPQVVLDPFLGSGTTAIVARRMGRHAIGIDLNAEYLEMAARRLAQRSLFA